MEELHWSEGIGKKINRNLFSPEGVLLISLSTVLTQEHMNKLKQYGITLTNEDVEWLDEDSSSKSEGLSIDESVAEVTLIFNEIRNTRKIPLVEIRQKIVPAIQETIQTEHFSKIFTTLQAVDDYTFRHNIAVGAYATLLGMWMGLPKKDLLQLTTAGVLHDVGKMFIPQEILDKPGKLTDEEFAIMKEHTILGYEVLKNTRGINHRQALVALQHHERMDGSGYPLGITKEKIDLFSRIVGIVDVFHAMTSTKVYRDASPFYEILISMENDAFGVLDAQITRLFIEKMMNYLSGYSVLLTDGREGKIIMIHPHEPTRPLIQVGNEFIDLRKSSSTHIKQILA